VSEGPVQGFWFCVELEPCACGHGGLIGYGTDEGGSFGLMKKA